MDRIDRKFTLVGMMRVKNEEEWLEAAILSMSPLADRIIILDDGSTDGTGDICRKYSDLVDYHYQNEDVTDEARDKNRLFEWALAYNPDWILALDGDEVLEELAPSTIIQEIHLLDPDDPQFTVFYFHFLYFWNSKETYRTEAGIYSNFWQPRLFSVRGQHTQYLRFRATDHGGNFHCGSVPKNLVWRPRKLDVKVKHYGYLWEEQRQQKKEWYTKLDPEQASKGYYDHLTQEEGMILARWEERSKASSASFVKDSHYYQFARPEIVDCIPKNLERILDIGCGFGFLGREIKKNSPDTKVFGVEIDALAAQAAKALLDDVQIGNIETEDLQYPDDFFDCIILADVLEHLVDPWKVLLKVHRFLKHDGTLIISVPNVRNLGIISSLLAGQWRYLPAGILDNTHLRFFTLKEIQRILMFLGYNIVQTFGVRDLSLDQLTVPERNQIRIIADSFEWNDLDRATVQELHSVQFVIQGKKHSSKEVAKNRELTSIIIPVFNQLELTRLCIDHIMTYTPEPFELIIVDNGSDETMKAYLQSLENVKVIWNDENQGFARACNQGFAMAQGEYLLMLNNDVIVGEGWLGHMIDHFTAELNVGMVGPCSNYVGTIQKIPRPYNGLEQYYHFVREFYWENRGQYLITHRLAGMCMLIKKEVIELIGGFDERFGKGNFEDDDLCLRAMIAGYKLLVAKDCYVHHFGSVTFREDEAEYAELLAKNWLLFKIKWQIDPTLQDRNLLSISEVIHQHPRSNRYYLPFDQTKVEEQRKSFDEMFMAREKFNSEACQLEYWQNHFCTRLALESEQIHGHILDAGCGSGEIDIWLARQGYQITGVDLSAIAVYKAIRFQYQEPEEVRQCLRFYQESLERLPFEDATFDSCILFEVMEHIEDSGPVFKELRRVLKKNATILLTVPLEDYYKDLTHVHSFTPESLEDKLRQYASSVQVENYPDEHQIVAYVADLF